MITGVKARSNGPSRKRDGIRGMNMSPTRADIARFFALSAGSFVHTPILWDVGNASFAMIAYYPRPAEQSEEV